jgi:peptidoglycan/xylan/chitin deacetylase (PgdA/CDA1 family)
MKQKIKKIIAKFWPSRYRTGVLILNYHSINPNHKFSTQPADFEAQMKYVSENFKVIRLKDVYNPDLKGLNLVISFDDGFSDNYQYAYPILKKYNLKATIFLVSDFIINNLDITKDWAPYHGLAPLKLEEIKEMSDSGLIDFGSHGKTHDQVSSFSQERLRNELIESKQKIEQIVNKSIDCYAFPFGQKKQRGDFSMDFFASLGFKQVCTTDWGINKNLSSSCFLKRIRIDAADSLLDFRRKIAGRWDFVKLFQYLRNIK